VHTDAAVRAEQVVDAHRHAMLVHADHADAAGDGEGEQCGAILRLYVEQNHVGRGAAVHIPGLSQIAAAVASRCRCDDERSAAAAVEVRAGLERGRPVMRQRRRVRHDVDEVGEAVHDHQLVEADAGGVAHAAHLLHQFRGKGGVVRQTSLAQRQHFGQRRLLPTRPEGVAAQPQPFFGQFADGAGVGCAVSVADVIGCAAQRQATNGRHLFLLGGGGSAL
jgi:hypothetical protein